MCLSAVALSGKCVFSPNRNYWGPLLRRKRNAALELGARGFVRPARGSGAGGSRMGGTRVWSWRSAEFGSVACGFGGCRRSLGGWHGARRFGWLVRSSGGGSHNLDGRHAAQELGTGGCMEFGWVAGPRAQFRWMARGSGTGGAGGPRCLDGWHALE